MDLKLALTTLHIHEIPQLKFTSPPNDWNISVASQLNHCILDKSSKFIQYSGKPPPGKLDTTLCPSWALLFTYVCDGQFCLLKYSPHLIVHNTTGRGLP